jgi:hypothetical protein
MAQGELFEVVLSGQLGNVEVWQAAFKYSCSSVGSGDGSANDLSAAFEDVLVPLLQDAMVSDVNMTNITVQNYNTLTDQHNKSITYVGSLSGDPMPPVLAVGMRSPKNGRGLNRSRHNLPLGSSGWFGGDGSIDIDLADAVLYPLQQQLGIEITGPDSSVWFPVTFTKVYSEGVIVAAVFRAFAVGQWSVNVWPTTVKSRQPYEWRVVEEPA